MASTYTRSPAIVPLAFAVVLNASACPLCLLSTVASIDVLLSSRKDVVFTWRGRTGEGQTGAGKLGLTPSVVPGVKSKTFASAC